MAWWDIVRGWFSGPSLPAHTFGSDTPRPIDIVIGEMLRGTGRVARAEALSVPAMLRGRNLICSIATLPLVQYGPDRRVARLPLLEQIDPDVPNGVTLAQTVEDLLFDSIAWWRVIERGFDKFPTYARHLDVNSVSLQPPGGQSPSPLPAGHDPRNSVVYVDGEAVPARDVIRFDSPNPAVLVAGARAIRRALLLDRMAETYAEGGRPLDYFSPADGADPADDDEVAEILSDWRTARRVRGTAYVPAALQYNTVDSPSPADLQLVQLQMRAALDIANALGLDPEELGVSTTSRTYSNVIDRRRDKINDTLAPYMSAITDRLSMGDVTRRGYVIEFDLDDYLKSNPTERWSVYEKAKNMGVLTVDEIRAEEGLPALTAAQRRELEPAPAAVPEPDQTNVRQLRPASATFAGQAHTFISVSSAQFKVDAERRTIEGLALPYGKVAENYSGRFRFEPGALQYADTGRVKLLRDHDFSQALGRLVSADDRPEGMFVKYKVARGPAGDEALSLAEDGVLDGFSVGIDFDAAADTAPDPDNKGVILVRRADWRETSLTAMPAFDDARVTRVAASRNGGNPVEDDTTATTTAPAPVSPDFNTMFAQFMASQQYPLSPPAGPTFVNPARTVATAIVNEAAPYRFDRRTGNVQRGSHEFSADIFAHLRGDQAAHDRLVEFAQKHVEFVITTDVDELNPTRQRPDLYVDQRTYEYPMWQSINKGTLTDLTPFTFPKFSSAGTLVAAHVEGTEPSLGTFVTTSQTVTPAAVSGKVKLTRETIDQGGNPQVSNLIWRQMLKAWYEALEAKAALVLTANAASITDVTLTTGGGTTGQTAASETEAAFTALQFIRGGFSMDTMFTQIDYFKVLAAAKDGQGRPLYPRLGPTNANGQSQARFRALDVAGVTMWPAWALAASGSVAASSFLFDKDVVHGWASAPQRIDIDRTEVANVYIGLFGYTATAISDFTGVREFVYDPV